MNSTNITKTNTNVINIMLSIYVRVWVALGDENWELLNNMGELALLLALKDLIML